MFAYLIMCTHKIIRKMLPTYKQWIEYWASIRHNFVQQWLTRIGEPRNDHLKKKVITMIS